MPKICLTSKRGPRAVGPYSIAVRAGRLVFCSGLIGLDPATGEMVPGGIADQTRQVMENLQAVLEDNGLGLGAVVKTTCFLTDLGSFAEFNEVYARFFGDDPPARSTVQVGALPKDALVEVEALAIIDS